MSEPVDNKDMSKINVRDVDFWLTLLANIAGATAASGALTKYPEAIQVLGIVVAVLATMGYKYKYKKGAYNGRSRTKNDQDE